MSPPVGLSSIVGGAFPGLFHGRSAAGCCILSKVGRPIGPAVAAEADFEIPIIEEPAAFEAVIAACPRAAAGLGLEDELAPLP